MKSLAVALLLVSGIGVAAADEAPAIGQMEVTPTTGLDSSGPVGGPFLPQSVVYTVSNSGTTSFSFTATSTQAWCGVFAGSGTLAPGESWSVIVYILEAANTMTPGTYNDTVTFTNTTDGMGNTTRAVTLTITNGTGAGPIIVTPGTGWNSTGPVGGPFSPASQDYVITNNGTSSVDWTATSAQTWITMSPASGTLAAGASTTVTVTINSNANSLANGTYAAWTSFTNVTSGNGNTTRAVGLNVTNAPQAGPISVSPGGGLSSTGSTGGPFTPSSLDYVVTNNGALSVDFTVSATQSWVFVNPPGGSLGPGQSATVTVSINGFASSLAAGTYTDTVTFTNVTSGLGTQTRAVSLTVTAGSVAGPLTVTPATGITSTGPVGGPFTNMSQNYTLTNTGTAPLDWSVSATQSWMTVLPQTGTLAAGASTTVQVSINGTAIFLAAGTYSDTVTFTNLTNGSGDTTRPVSLTVTSTPVAGPITVTPSTGFSSSGPVGGPFSPASTSYTVTNTGSASVDLTVGNTQGWLTVSPTSATIGAGSSVTVVLTINANANSLPAGTYFDTVTFTNVTNGTGDTTRAVTLSVGSTDSTPPTVTIVTPAPPTATSTTSPVTITGTASDNIAVTGVTWANAATGGNGSATGTTSWTASVPLASGSNLITITAYDAAGNSGSATITITYTPSTGDITPPTVQITSPTTASTWSTGSVSIALGGLASDNVALSTITWFNAATGQSGTASGLNTWTATIPLASGSNAITVSAFDTSGNSSTDTIAVDSSAGSVPATREGSNGDSGINDSCGGQVRGGSWMLAIAALLALLAIRRK